MKTCHIVCIVLLLFTVASVSGRSARQLHYHECPAYECEDDVNNTGCEHGEVCAVINCGNICVPPNYFNLQTLVRRTEAARKRQEVECPQLECGLYCPYGYRTGLDGCQMCGCIFVG